MDLVATRGNDRFFIEVETGKSDVQANIAKCKGNTLILPGDKVAFTPIPEPTLRTT